MFVKCLFLLWALFILFHLLLPCFANAQEARLKEIRLVNKGDLVKQDKTVDMSVFVNVLGQDGRPMTMSSKNVPLNCIVSVESGANLLVEYNDQKGWLNYNARIRVENDGVRLEEGEFYVLKPGRWFNTLKLALQGYSEYYVRVNSDGETTLYVIDGTVLAEDRDTGDKKIVSKSMAIDESLKDIQLSDREIKRIRMWRDQLHFSFSPLSRMGRWAKNHILTMTIAAAAGIIIWEAFFSPELNVIVNW